MAKTAYGTLNGELTKRAKLEILRAQLDNERSSFIEHWRDLSTFISPRRSRFTVTDVNKGDKRNQKIIDSTATSALRTLRAGMMGGITSPARRWFRLTTNDPMLSEVGAVKQWLYDVEHAMSTVFLRSNIYNKLSTIYQDIGQFATSALYIEEDMDTVIRAYEFPIGSYMIGNDSKLRVRIFMRDFRMTVRQLVDQFGRTDPTDYQYIEWDKFSTYIKNAWDLGNTEQWIDVCHVIKPNDDYDPKKIESKFKKFYSCYYERGGAGAAQQNYLQEMDRDKYLSEKGYDIFPVLVPRWEVTGEDVYGTNCPAMEALGDIKQLMVGEKRTMQAVEKGINPPMVGPTSMRNAKSSILPGDTTYIDIRDGQQGFRPAHEVNFNIQQMEVKQGQVRSRINEAFYKNLFLMLEQDERSGTTATEIVERKQEKLVVLGPVLEQLNQDLLDPLIDITFSYMLNQGRIPRPPQELQGQPLKVEYISILAQAQKSADIGSVERLAGFVGNVAASIPMILDKLDTDQMVDVYGDLTSVPPSIIRTQDIVNQIRAARAKQQAMQNQAAMIHAGSQSAKNLSQASLDGKNALSEIVNQSQAGALL